MNTGITIALSKGRILQEAIPLFAGAGIELAEDPDESRKLIIPSTDPQVRFLVIRASDVPTYVTWGAADVGIAGKDVLLEQEGLDLYEPLDLRIGLCRMSVAEPAALAATDAPQRWERVRIATKYPHITRDYFHGRGVQTEIIKLYGSMELAPLVGLADRIVDLVSSGRTLRENGLVEVEEIMPISSRLVVNRAAMKLKRRAIEQLITQLEAQVSHEPS
ncbi:ATP phosphoribosyltransferase [Acidithiobacillus montserratensis]|uniref:ATP phosphoribosyltransferase n=1 Tax=Acidithiobacillus montserratensis TaxID=2729135 RepID=A0ACD5HFF7_9PROT|nr:ATP phosphoribosyltransferase [Acidithiobacillus montserratensis]MBN2679086.1 ATP phosphoribosyltransferase [Acidithiobacillaceae bacterium]MBU2747013.1 ATP phosphoribosyltransferase [Acidithiobacillus montserratensis]